MSRKNYRIYNILDMEIVPIDFHALQREVPFTNLLNYSYTFDKLVKEHFDYKDPKPNPTPVGYNDTMRVERLSPESAMVEYMCNPFSLRSKLEYINQVARIYSGNTSLSLGHPKFLSDQLWNKVLLNSLYDLGYVPESNGEKMIDRNESRVINIISSMNRFIGQRTRLVANSINEIAGNTRMSLARRLTYMHKGEIKDLQFHKFASTNAQVCHRLAEEGYNRYNTVMIRSVEWLVLLQRAVRILMQNQLQWIGDPIVSEIDAISEEVTEYSDNRMFSIEDYE